MHAIGLLFALTLATSPAHVTPAKHSDYYQVVKRTAAMASNGQAQQLAKKYGMQVLNVMWEDTGRYKGSSVGPNISDVTIQVQQRNPKTRKYDLTLMPVIRYPNFSDKTADLKMKDFHLLVGNDKGNKLEKVDLREFLGNIRKYLSDGDSWKGKKKSLLAKRDKHVLVSAQAAFLPVPKKGIAEFNPVIFNYQSYKGDPAVLTILATREGTSVTVIDNKRDGFEAGRTWGQRLFFNQDGKRASLTGQRASDFNASGARDGSSDGKGPEAAGQSGLNMVLLIQVPLKQKRPMRLMPAVPTSVKMMRRRAGGGPKSNVEEAVIGHGKVEGPFTEIDGLDIERDARFPVRVTAQFYKATSNGVVSPADMESIAKQIKRVYADAEYVGSLVTGGETGRPTEYDGSKVEPPGWWDAFWKRHQENTGQTREEAIEMLKKLMGPKWMPRTEAELRERLDALRM